MANENEIRPYGPGKFSTILDSYVYQVSLDGGPDAECGDSSCGSWYGLMRHGHTIFRDHDPLLESLNEAEADFYLRSVAGCIVREDSDGFVTIEYFDTTAKLDAAWEAIEAEQSESDESEDA